MASEEEAKQTKDEAVPPVTGNMTVPADDPTPGLSKLAAGKDWLEKKRAGVRPWAQFLSYSKIGRPANFSQAKTRLIANVEHYQNNYLFVCIGLAVYCM